MVRIALEAMAGLDGLDGCALVDIETGMLWHAAGDARSHPGLAEAASDFWRLHGRQHGCFDPLGDLQAMVLMHSQRRVTLVGCGPGLLLVVISGRDAPVDWTAWTSRRRELESLADSF